MAKNTFKKAKFSYYFADRTRCLTSVTTRTFVHLSWSPGVLSDGVTLSCSRGRPLLIPGSIRHKHECAAHNTLVSKGFKRTINPLVTCYGSILIPAIILCERQTRLRGRTPLLWKGGLQSEPSSFSASFSPRKHSEQPRSSAQTQNCLISILCSSFAKQLFPISCFLVVLSMAQYNNSWIIFNSESHLFFTDWGFYSLSGLVCINPRGIIKRRGGIVTDLRESELHFVPEEREREGKRGRERERRKESSLNRSVGLVLSGRVSGFDRTSLWRLSDSLFFSLLLNQTCPPHSSPHRHDISLSFSLCTCLSIFHMKTDRPVLYSSLATFELFLRRGQHF